MICYYIKLLREVEESIILIWNYANSHWILGIVINCFAKLGQNSI